MRTISRLKGQVRVGGSKNAVLPAIAASLLTDGEVKLRNVPLVKDVYSMLNLMRELGSDSELKKSVLSLQTRKILSVEAPYELVSTMRASFLVLGPLLARVGRAGVAMPGGCAIGSRPIDLHLKGLERLGPTITLAQGYVEARAARLKGARDRLRRRDGGGDGKPHDGRGARRGHHHPRERGPGARDR